jgi:MFS family permease
MKSSADQVLRTYLTLVAVSTSASSMIWGINTLFLLDAGLSIGEAFAANAFFTAGMVLFEVPTGVVADTVGRRTSYLLGAATLVGSTLLYLLLWQTAAPFAAWAVASVLLGLGFTFFSGATEAWLVDGLNATGYRGSLDAAFAKGQVVGGIAMLGGAVGGGLLAQWTNLGVPYSSGRCCSASPSWWRGGRCMTSASRRNRGSRSPRRCVASCALRWTMGCSTRRCAG